MWPAVCIAIFIVCVATNTAWAQLSAGLSPGSSESRQLALLQPRRVGQLMMTGSMYLDTPYAVTSNVTSIVSGGSSKAAILKNGTAVVWGSFLDSDTLSGPVYFVTTESPVRQVAVGYYYALVLLANGTVLKVPTGDDAPLPAELRSGGMIGVASGAYTSVAIRRTGSLFVWDVADKSVRAQLSALTGVRNVSIGYSMNEDVKMDTIMVLFENKTVRVFSQDAQFGQSVVPKTAVGGVTAVAAGAKHCYALVNGSVVAWGEVPGTVKVPSKARKDIVAIAAGQDHTLALTVTGEVVCWGSPGACRGLDSLTTPASGIAAATGFSAVVGTDSRVRTWDGPDYGEYMYEVPGELMTAKISAIAAGQDHALAILDDSSLKGVVGFGSNRWGQVIVPPAAQQPKAVKAVAAGAFHSLALLTTGKVVSWGKPLAWVPADREDVVDIVAGRDVSCVVYSSAGVECFGNTTRLKLSMIQGVPVAKVALQRLNALALTEQGAVISFGAWSNANLPEAAQSNVVDVAASRDAGLVLLSNGSLIRFSLRDSSIPVWTPQVPCKRISRVTAGADAFMVVCEDGQASTLDALSYKNKSYSQVLQAVGGAEFNLFLIRTQSDLDQPPAPPPPAIIAGKDDSPLPASLVSPAFITKSQFNPERLEQQPDGPSSSKVVVAGAAVGGSVGALLLAALLLAAAWKVYQRKRKYDLADDVQNPATKAWADQKNQYVMRAGPTKPDELNLIGVGKGELYARTTAHEYTWSSVSAASQHLVPVEAGVNDLALDKLLDDSEAIDGPQVIKLTQEEVKQQIFLLQDGLLGKGATAVAFKALWPERFGPNGVVAVKMLKDGHEADMATLQSFAYEASVLASTRHPCVVTMYGYCLEPPTCCLILEAMQHSLKDMLYSHATPHGASTAQSQPKAASSHHSGGRLLNQHLLLPIPEPAPSCASLDEALEDMAPCIQITLAEDPRPSTSSEVRSSAVRSSAVRTSDQVQPLKEKSSSLALSTLDTLEPPLSVARVLEISRDIAAGLAYLHDTPLEGTSPWEQEGVQALQGGHYRNGSSRRVSEIVADLDPDRGSPRYSDAGIKPGRIVHRDLKPANVLLNSVGQAKLSDFGLAREHTATSIHTERVGAGTLPYQAPEILMSSYGTSYLPMTNKVDIYSAAMIIYEMLARAMPWKGLGEMAVLAAVTGSRRPELPASPSGDGVGRVLPSPEVLAQMPASLSALPELTSIIRACWHQRYHKRPSAAELHAQLTRLLQE